MPVHIPARRVVQRPIVAGSEALGSRHRRPRSRFRTRQARRLHAASRRFSSLSSLSIDARETGGAETDFLAHGARRRLQSSVHPCVVDRRPAPLGRRGANRTDPRRMGSGHADARASDEPEMTVCPARPSGRLGERLALEQAGRLLGHSGGLAREAFRPLGRRGAAGKSIRTVTGAVPIERLVMSPRCTAINETEDAQAHASTRDEEGHDWPVVSTDSPTLRNGRLPGGRVFRSVGRARPRCAGGGAYEALDAPSGRGLVEPRDQPCELHSSHQARPRHDETWRVRSRQRQSRRSRSPRNSARVVADRGDERM